MASAHETCQLSVCFHPLELSLSRSPQRTASQRGNCSADVPTTMPVMQGYSLANYPKAVCVDSSPAMYYFLAATSVASANTWIVYLRGGGVCMP